MMSGQDEDYPNIQKEMYIATLTHDMKNSVQAQLLSLNMLNKGTLGSLNAQQKEIVTMIIESVSYMKDMFYAMLNTYACENGYIKLVKNKFDVDIFMQNCLNEIKIGAEEKKLHIVYCSNMSGQELYADAVQLRRVVSNLLNNAVSYAMNNSKIKVFVFVRDGKMIFEFSNVGAPIPPDVRKHLFDKYVTGAYTFNKTGYGLGLYASKKVVEAHKGEIFYKAAENENIFSFEIPLDCCEESDTGIMW